MILIRTKSSNIIFLLVCSGLGLNQDTETHLEEKKPRWKLGQAAQMCPKELLSGFSRKGISQQSGNGFTGDSLWKSRACPALIS